MTEPNMSAFDDLEAEWPDDTDKPDVCCRVCGEQFADDEWGVWNGVQWAHERCDEQPTPPERPDTATLDLFATPTTTEGE